MERIHGIFSIMTKNEKKHLKMYLDTFHGKKENKLLELVNLIEKHPNITQQKAAFEMYGDAKSKAFIMTKTRLLERMHETLLDCATNPNNTAIEEDAVSYRLIQAYKTLTIAYILQLRGLRPLAFDLLNNVLSAPEIIPFAPARLLMMEHLRMTMPLDIEAIQGLNEAIEDVQQSAISDSMASGIERVFNSFSKIKNYSQNQFIAFLEQKISELEQIKAQHYSIFSDWIHMNLQHYLADMQNNVALKEESVNRLLELLMKYPLLANNNRMGALFYRKGFIVLDRFDFEQACSFADQAEKYLTTNKHGNLLNAYILKALARFYMGDFQEMERAWEQYETFPKKMMLVDNVFFLKYLILCRRFVEGNYKAFMQYLNQLEDLLISKDHWNIAVRFLEIYMLIDQGQLDWVSAKIEALRKHISNHDSLPLHFYIYKVLNQIERNNFSFHPLPEKIRELLVEMRKNHRWMPTSFEIIRIETWVHAREQNIPYWSAFTQELKTLQPPTSSPSSL
jgi:hypothetical protein